MKKLLLSILAFFTFNSAQALAPYDIRLMQRDPTNVGYLQRDLALPAGGAHGIIGMNGTSMLPQYIFAGTGIILTGSTISADTTYLLSRANHTGTQTASTISDFTEAAQDAIGPAISGAGSVSVSYNDSSNLITITGSTPAARSQSSASRTLNSCFQVSSTRDSLVNYSVDISTQATLLGGQTGTVFLEIFDDSGCTTNTQELTRFVNGNSVSLAIAITITQNVTGTLTGYVPSGKYAKIRTANTTGTPTFTYRSGQEVLL